MSLRPFKFDKRVSLYGNTVKASTGLQPAKGRRGVNSRTLRVSLISISAALYAAAIAVTSPIPTPWGVGHFRPGVLIPAFFSVVCGPLVGGIGAAIGCFIGDFALSMFGLTNPLLSLIAGVPGNFVGFYLLGWFVSKYRSWASFVTGSFVALMVGNLIAALGVVGFFSFIIPNWASWATEVKLSTVLGFTFFWVATMAPFVIPFTPLLVRGAKPILSRIEMGADVSKMSWGKPLSLLRSSAVVAIVLAALYIIGEYAPWGSLFFPTFWIRTLLLMAAGVVFTFGVIITLVLSRHGKSLS